MKKSEKQELRARSVEELEAIAAELRRELMDGRFKQATEGEGIGMRKRQIRRQVGRIQTILNEKRQTAGA